MDMSGAYNTGKNIFESAFTPYLYNKWMGDSGAPYDAAMGQYKDWANRAQQAQNPFYNAGVNSIPGYQNWVGSMQDPSAFLNHLMGQYQESPYAQYLTQQSMRAGTNAASASGMTGSTPFVQQMQQNAGNIASGDMQDWLARVLGVNTTYGQGQQNLMMGGQNSANALTNMYGHMGDIMGEQAYNKGAAGNNDMWNKIGGVASLASMFL